jgi:ABC-2 type transport system permease protein
MMTIFWRTIKDKKVMIIVYCLASILLLTMYIAMFPSIQKQSETFKQAMSNYPQSLMKALKVDNIDFTHLENFLAMEKFSITWPLMAIFLLSSVAGTALSGEVEKGTAEILLSRPVSRIKIFFGKYCAGLLALLIFAACSTLIVAPLASMFKIDFVFKGYLIMSLLCLFFGLAVFSMAMMWSAIFSERSKTYMLTGGILIVMYVLNIVATLKDSFDKLKYFSFFYYFDSSSALIHTTLNATSVFVFIGVAIVCTTIGVWWFNKRDIAV